MRHRSILCFRDQSLGFKINPLTSINHLQSVRFQNPMFHLKSLGLKLLPISSNRFILKNDRSLCSSRSIHPQERSIALFCFHSRVFICILVIFSICAHVSFFKIDPRPSTSSVASFIHSRYSCVIIIECFWSRRKHCSDARVIIPISRCTSDFDACVVFPFSLA